MLRLVPIDHTSWHECIDLPTSADHARFVAPNVYSLAEAHFYPKAVVRCVYNDDRLVGFVMFGPSEENPGVFWIDRIMIAEPDRGKGYGRAALQLVLGEALSAGYAEVGLSTAPENERAIRLFESAGFAATGELDGCEAVYRYCANGPSAAGKQTGANRG